MAVEERETTTEEEAAPALSVSAAMGLAKNALEEVVVRLVGEVSEVNDKPGYKAVYFTVKDEKASLPCMMWMNRYQASGVALSVGALVELTGRFSLYAAKGRMNFDVFSVSLAGEGQLRLQVANLAREREAMGLMDPARKRLLPAYPETIGLVTSPRGAAVTMCCEPCAGAILWPASCSPAFPWRAPGRPTGSWTVWPRWFSPALRWCSSCAAAVPSKISCPSTIVGWRAPLPPVPCPW